jgi:hypothetical protein
VRAGQVVARDETGHSPAFGFALDLAAADGARGVLRAASGETVVLPWPGEAGQDLEVVGPGMPPVRCTVARRGPALAFALPEVADGTSGVPMPRAFVGRPRSEWGRRGRTVAVLTMDGAAPSTWVRVSGAEWVRVLSDDPELRAAEAIVVQVGSAAELRGLLRAAEGERPFAVVNPGGEFFYAEDAAAAEAMLDDIRAYVSTGGVWWETGGYSFYVAASRDAQGRWTARRLEGSGARRLGFSCVGLAVDEPPQPLRVTAVGRQWLGDEAARRLEAAASGVQRGFAEEQGVLVLVDSAAGDFAAGSRCGGWGWLLRLGGFNPDPEVAALVVCGALRQLLTAPWPEPERRRVPRLWEVRLAAH